MPKRHFWAYYLLSKASCRSFYIPGVTEGGMGAEVPPPVVEDQKSPVSIGLSPLRNYFPQYTKYSIPLWNAAEKSYLRNTLGIWKWFCFLLFARVEASIVISVLSFAAITKPTDSTDECSSSPCQNGGTCVNRYNDYLCVCADGYSGKSCQTGGHCWNISRAYLLFSKTVTIFAWSLSRRVSMPGG